MIFNYGAHWMTHTRPVSGCPWCELDGMELVPMTDHRDPVDTRLVLLDPAGTPITDPKTNRLMGLVLTNVPNADAAAPLFVAVEQQCDMLHWHQIGRTPLPNYDGAWPAEPIP